MLLLQSEQVQGHQVLSRALMQGALFVGVLYSLQFNIHTVHNVLLDFEVCTIDTITFLHFI